MQPAKKSHTWQEAIKFINKCPICGAVYARERARVISQEATANLVHISCDACRGNFLALIVVSNRGISTIGMVSDLTYDDAGKMHNTEPISIDELIDGRYLINQNNNSILKF